MHLIARLNTAPGPQVKDGKSGATEEVSTASALDGKHVALYFTSQAVEQHLAGANQVSRPASRTWNIAVEVMPLYVWH
jgi:hypothetical protein